MAEHTEITLHPKVSLYRHWIAALALMIIPISGLSIDIYVPSLPAVSRYFQVDNALTQFTITAYMFGLGIMQLFAGSLSDTYGRRKPFLIANFIYILATLAIPFAYNIQQLIFLRFVQGVLVAVMIVPMRAVISDLYVGPEFHKMVSYMTITWAIGPIIAPAIGGYLQAYFGWKSNFYFLAAYALAAFALNLYGLHETSKYRHPLHFVTIVKRYTEILCNRHFLESLFLSCILLSLVILFTVVGPFLIQDVMHYTAIQYGHIALLTGFAWFLSSLLNRLFIDLSYERKIKINFLCLLVISTVSLIVSLLLPMSIYTVVVPVILLFLAGGMIFPANFARAVSLFPTMTGSANALFGGGLFLLTSIGSGLSTMLKATTNIPLLSIYVLLSLIGVLIACKVK